MTARRAIALLGTVIGAFGGLTVTPATADPAPWTAEPITAISEPGGVLTSVSCSTPSLCFAVGTLSTPNGPTVPFAQKLDNGHWTRIVASASAGAVSARLDAVSCRDGHSCVAVGRWQPNAASANTRPFTLRYNSIGFVQDPVPPAAGFPSSSLSGVDCGGECFAVGSASSPTTTGPVFTIYNPVAKSWTAGPTPPSGPHGDSVLRAISCTSNTSCVAVGSDSTDSLVERWDGSAWTIEPTPSIGPLVGISCTTTTTFCVAVASRSTTSQPATGALHFDGTTWSAVSTPRSDPANIDDLRSVSCASSTDCSAVGVTTRPGATVTLGFAEHWDGAAWSIEHVAQQTPPSDTVLSGVSCSAGDCLGVGRYGTSADDPVTEVGARPLAVSRSNNDWLTVSGLTGVKTTRTSLLADISCPTDGFCAAVGTQGMTTTPIPLLEQRTGPTWSVRSRNPLPAGATSANAVSCATATACLALGMRGATPTALLWNGTTWSIAPAPAGTTSLSAVSCDAPTSCTAVDLTAQAFHWDGTNWTKAVLPPLPAYVKTPQLTGVSCTSAVDCTAVGSYASGAYGVRPLVFVRSNSGWSWFDAVGPAGRNVVFHGVSCVAVSSCVAVGSVITNMATARTLVETFDGLTWSEVATPTLSGYSSLTDISCTSTDFCGAVGQTGVKGVDLLALGWDGTAWSTVPTSPPAGAVGTFTFTGISCAASRCSASGTNVVSAAVPKLAGAQRPFVLSGSI